MKIKNTIAISLLLIFIPTLLMAEEEYSMDFNSALKQMLETNSLLKSVRYEREKANYDRKAAMGLYFPKIDINFSYTHINEPITMDFNPLRDAMINLSAEAYAKGVVTANSSMTPYYNNLKNGFIQNADSNPALARSNFIETIQEQNFWSVSATVKQPLFTGGKIIAANKAAEAVYVASSEKERYTQYALTTELASRYYALRLAIKIVEVRKQVLDGMAEHLNQAKKLEENGMIASAERLHAEVAYSEALREYKKALKDKDTAMAALRNTLSSEKDILPVSELFLVTDIHEMSYYKKKASELNPVLAQLRANQTIAHQAYMKELARYSPDIFAFGSKNLVYKNLSETTPEWYVGVGATFTLFDGMSRYNNLQAAGNLEKKVDEAIAQANKDIDTLVEKSYNELLKDMEQIETLEKAIEFAREYLRVREASFASGFGTSIDVVDARLNLSKVEIERLNSMYEFDISLASLLEVSGLSDEYIKYMYGAKTEKDILTQIKINKNPLSLLKK